MIDLTKVRNFYIACGYTDLRLGIDGLAAVVKQQYGSHFDEESLFLFCGRRTDRIKALYWCGDGYMRINELAQAEPYRQKVEKLGCFRGIAAHTALSFCVEVGDFRRFTTAQQFASYLGLVPGECSSGDKQQYTGITKAGNSHLRKLLVETAQVFGRSATKSGKSVALKERQAKCDSLTVAYADKANTRLKKKYFKIAMRNCNAIKGKHCKDCCGKRNGLFYLGDDDR